MENLKSFKNEKSSKGLVFLAVTLSFFFVFSCKSEGNGDGTPTIVKYTLTITPPICGTITDGDAINCGSKGNVCKAQVANGDEVKLIAEADEHYTLGAWGDACASTDAGGACKLTMDANKTVSKAFTASTSDSDNDCIPNDIDTDDDNDTVPDATDVDDDNDGLIEVHDLDMFNHIRHNLAGTSYKTGANATDNRMGAPEKDIDDCTSPIIDGDKSFYLCGYELMRDLDFADAASYADGTVNSAWRPLNASGSVVDADNAINAGFVGIDNGFGEEGFASIFEGNGYTISNLYSRNTDDSSPGDGSDGNPRARVGLFKRIEANAIIRNLGVVDARLYGSASGHEQIGSLVAKNKGKILACHATGAADGGDGVDTIGGLVGISTCCTRTTAGTIVGSYAMVAVDGGNGEDDVGGLVGFNSKEGSIIASYATGAVNGSGDKDSVGGLVGVNIGSIIASYATGAVNDDGGNNNHVGGLVGRNNDPEEYYHEPTKSTIIASFATGNVTGSPGSEDSVGGLVGKHQGYIYTSYATGNANGGAGDRNGVGGLVGRNGYVVGSSYATGDADGGTGSEGYASSLVGHMGRSESAVYNSYGFGGASNGSNTDVGATHPRGLNSILGKANRVNALTTPGSGNTAVSAQWDDTSQKTKDAWDFGTNSQPPALKYADYDGTRSDNDVDYCALFPAKIPGTDTDLVCGNSLLPGQGR